MGRAPGLVTPHPFVALLKIPLPCGIGSPGLPTPRAQPLSSAGPYAVVTARVRHAGDFLPWEGDRLAGVPRKTPPGPDLATGDEGCREQEGRGRPWYLPVAHTCLVAQPRAPAWPRGD